MSFFNSDIVRQELQDIEDLQKNLTRSVLRYPIMSKTEKLEHVKLLETLLEKQKILFTRMSLSDDPKAIETKERMIESTKLMGYGSPKDMSAVFDNMQKVVERLKKEAEVDL